MRRRSRVGPRKGSQENCSETRCLPKRVRQSLNTQPGASGTQDVCIKCGLTFAVKPSPGYKSEKKRDLDIGVGFLFVDRPLPLAIDASEGDSGRSTLRGADQILQGQLHQTALSCACRDARWSPISGHNYRPAPHNKLAIDSLFNDGEGIIRRQENPKARMDHRGGRFGPQGSSR